MSTAGDERLAAIERQLEALIGRIDGLEARLGGAPARGLPAAGTPQSAPTVSPRAAAAMVSPPVPPAPAWAAAGYASPPLSAADPATGASAAAKPSLDLEELLGGRVLAWVGGISIVLGVAFFVAVAINRGWIDEPTRIVVAAAASLALLGAGVWLRERRGAAHAALAAAGAAIASLYLTLTAATQLYDLVPAPVALVLALAVGTLAAGLAVRWAATAIGGLGIVGALLAPPLVGAEASAGTAGFLLVALVAAVGTVVWQEWRWLAVAALVVTAPQLIDFGLDAAPGSERWVAVAASVAYVGLMLAAAAGPALRDARPGPLAAPAIVVVGAALSAAVSGGSALADGSPGDVAADLWVLALALAYGAVGLGLIRARAAARPLGLLVLGVGIALADLAAPLLLDGALLVVVWAAGGLVLAAVAAGRAAGPKVVLARVACAAALTFATLRMLAFADGSDGPLSDSPATAGELAAVLAVAAAAAISARLAPRTAVAWRGSLEVLALASSVFLAALVLDGGGLVAALALEALVVLALTLARRFADPRVGLAGAAACASLAIGHALAYEAPPSALRDGLASPGEALLALGAVVAVLAIAAHRLRSLDRRVGRAVLTAAAVTALYLVSVLTVTAFGPEVPADLDGRQRGQLLLSGLWGIIGLAALLGGLVRDDRALRLGGFSLLILALGKVFLYDLSQLDSLYRVLSCVALGLLSLSAALAWQRIRPGGDGSSAPPPRAARGA